MQHGQRQQRGNAREGNRMEPRRVHKQGRNLPHGQ